jgi:isopenicillin N synthase-like dioxygenase
MAAKIGHTDQIPVIDLSGPEAEVAKQLVDAASTYGFVYVKSLGKDIPVEDIDSIFALVMSSTRHIIMYHTNICTVKGIFLFSH